MSAVHVLTVGEVTGQREAILLAVEGVVTVWLIGGRFLPASVLPALEIRASTAARAAAGLAEGLLVRVEVTIRPGTPDVDVIEEVVEEDPRLPHGGRPVPRPPLC